MSFAARLLGRHVSGRTQHLPLQGHDNLFRGPLRQPEVQQVRPAVQVQHDVRRLEVPVDDTALMGVVQGVGRLGE
jgi:hypothetical protein